MRRPDPRPIAIRAFTERIDKSPKHPQLSHKVPARPKYTLILDMETSIDATQRLLFGSYRLGVWLDADTLAIVEEGLIYADDLPPRDPQALQALRSYVKTHPPDVAFESNRALRRQGIWITRTLRLLSQREFLQKIFWKWAYQQHAVVVGFNLPFDLSRLARHAGQARRFKPKDGKRRPASGATMDEFSLRLYEYLDEHQTRQENRYRSRLVIRHLDSKKAFIRFGGRKKGDSEEKADDGDQRGRFLDLHTLAHALADQNLTLDKAAEMFGTATRKQKDVVLGAVTVETIDYNRQDVRVTQELLKKLLEEFDRHQLPVAPWRVYSPASLAKAYLRMMGLTPPLEKFREVVTEIVGPAMSAFYGGRAEGRIRKVIVPIVYCDFLSMYPTVNTLMGLWRLLTAERLELQDVTAEVQLLLDTLTVEKCFDRALWPQLVFFAEIAPDGDILPVRARYGDSPNWNIGINPLSACESFWYAGPDLAASVLSTGKAPKVLRAYRLVPVGRQPGLRSICVRGATPVDPEGQDLFKTVIEERYRLANDSRLSESERKRHKQIFKIVANSGGFGILAELNANREPKDTPATVTVYGRRDTFRCSTTAPEDPGPFCFPPLAAMTTAGARLMLALLERAVTDLGGTFAFCDTDSMAIIATEQGGLVACPGGPHRVPDGCDAIRALSWKQVRELSRRFDALHPYDRTVVTESILKIEDVNFANGRQRPLFAYVVAAKRYALFTLNADGTPLVDKERCSEHGLGHLLNPTDITSTDRAWIRQVWEGIIRQALRLPANEPPWLDRPALTRMAVTTPELLKRFAVFNKRCTVFADQIKPFNFALALHVHPADWPANASPDGFQLVAPYSTDPRQWERMPCVDRYTGKRYRIHTRESGVGVRVKTFRDVLASYPFHPEAKSLGPDGLPCGRQTVGLLGRRPVRPLSVVYIGKEANRLEDREAGLVHDLDEVQAEYRAGTEGDEAFRQVLRQIPSTRLAKLSGVSASLIRDIRSGRRRTTTKTRAALERAVCEYLSR